MKNKLNNKIVVVVLFVLMLTMLVVVDTYALFETDASANKELPIGEWVILLNNYDVSQTRTITLNDFTYTNGVHTQSNYFAPGSSAYFILTIDASDCQVSVGYELEIDDSDIADYPNIYFTITDMSNNQAITSSTYSGMLLLSSQNRTKQLKITLYWDNDPLYDESDTSLIGEDLAFTINANFIQYVGE